MTSRKRHQTKPRLDLNTRRTNPNIDQWTPHPFIQLLRSQRYTLTDRMLPTNDPFIPFVDLPNPLQRRRTKRLPRQIKVKRRLILQADTQTGRQPNRRPPAPRPPVSALIHSAM